MNKAAKIILPAVGVAAAAGLTLWLTAPGKHSTEQETPFRGRNFAHRGLHKANKTVPENSMAAFRAAVEAGYGIELDVHITADDELVVFHDDNLLRMCGVDALVEEQTLDELRTRALLHTEEGIPTLREVLEFVRGRVPLIVELKSGGRDDDLCHLVLAHLNAYEGDFCVESFNPFIVRWFRKRAPHILRGQLTCNVGEFGKATNPIAAFLVSRCLTNVLGRPQFIAHSTGRKALTVRICEAMGALKFCWTSRDWSHEDENDAVIFEHYRPAVRYRVPPRPEKVPCPLMAKLKSLFTRTGTPEADTPAVEDAAE